MPSYQSPRKSLVALLMTQLESSHGGLLTPDAIECLRDYGRRLEEEGFARRGDHLLAGLLLNAAEMMVYLPAGKLGKGGLELTRLQERPERVFAALRHERRRPLREKKGKAATGYIGELQPVVCVPTPAGRVDDDDGEEGDDAA